MHFASKCSSVAPLEDIKSDDYIRKSWGCETGKKSVDYWVLCLAHFSKLSPLFIHCSWANNAVHCKRKRTFCKCFLFIERQNVSSRVQLIISLWILIDLEKCFLLGYSATGGPQTLYTVISSKNKKFSIERIM